TTGTFRLRIFDGDHLFLRPRIGEVTAEVARLLAELHGSLAATPPRAD
ncbi:MAG: hypothetical protein QOJ63_3788, partial [Solirubrobacteraceae bacterium]|nr:hypothetical protein [Solirubrobacteraceae bacterium]